MRNAGIEVVEALKVNLMRVLRRMDLHGPAPTSQDDR